MSHKRGDRPQHSRPSRSSDSDDEELKGPTMNLAIVNGLFYVVTVLIGGNLIITGKLAIVLFGFSLYNFTQGLIWTPVTSIFTHSGIFHIGGNMIFLFIYGFRLEEMRYSDRGIYLSYLATGLLSTVLSAPLIGLKTISVGASGAVFGLLGTVTGVERREKNANYKTVLLASIVLLILSSTSPNTNIFAHIFGLIFGILLGNSKYFAQFKE